MPQYIKISDLKRSYNKFPCAEWKNSIRDLIKDNFLAEDSTLVEIPTGCINRMCKHGSEEMKKYVQDLGIQLFDDKNAFLPKINVHKADESLQNACNILFGKDNILQIAVDSANRLGREDLIDRALLLHSDYKVITHGEAYGTIIEIVKK